MYVKPIVGRQVPDPDRGGYLPPEGRAVEDNQYWQRRINDGDVEVIAELAAKTHLKEPKP